jgi:hypothetical protein
MEENITHAGYWLEELKGRYSLIDPHIVWRLRVK